MRCRELTAIERRAVSLRLARGLSDKIAATLLGTAPAALAGVWQSIEAKEQTQLAVAAPQRSKS